MWLVAFYYIISECITNVFKCLFFLNIYPFNAIFMRGSSVVMYVVWLMSCEIMVYCLFNAY